jgi:hypothetical protein
MATQSEILRQNYEELQAMQEDLARKKLNLICWPKNTRITAK